MNTERAKNAWERVAALAQWDASSSIQLGVHTAYSYRFNPKHLCFVLSRYKFCSKLLARRQRVLEVGCGDAFGTPLVAQAVSQLLAIDWDPRLIAWDQQHRIFVKNCTFKHHDVVAGPIDDTFDGMYSVDVIEHIDPVIEDQFMRHCCSMLSEHGLFIVGTPNATADQYASESSREGHINLKDAAGLEQLLSRYFETVFLFSMNDEVVHTGFYPMAHYLFGVGISVKRLPARTST